jgi:hypothetical protein
MGRASRHGQAMTDQPNQDRRGRRVRIIPHSCTLSTARSPATGTPADVPAEPGTSNDTDGPGRKVMSPETENCMKWLRQNHEQGTKCRPKSRPCTNVCTMCTPPLAGQTRDERSLPGSQRAAIRGRTSKTIQLSHVVTTTPRHERVTAINCPPETARRTSHNPRFQQAEGPQARHPHNFTGRRGARYRPRTASEGPAEVNVHTLKQKPL